MTTSIEVCKNIPSSSFKAEYFSKQTSLSSLASYSIFFSGLLLRWLVYTSPTFSANECSYVQIYPEILKNGGHGGRKRKRQDKHIIVDTCSGVIDFDTSTIKRLTSILLTSPLPNSPPLPKEKCLVHVVLRTWAGRWDKRRDILAWIDSLLDKYVTVLMKICALK